MKSSQVHSSFCVICKKKIIVFVIICLLCTTVFMGRLALQAYRPASAGRGAAAQGACRRPGHHRGSRRPPCTVASTVTATIGTSKNVHADGVSGILILVIVSHLGRGPGGRAGRSHNDYVEVITCSARVKKFPMTEEMLQVDACLLMLGQFRQDRIIIFRRPPMKDIIKVRSAVYTRISSGYRWD